MYNSEIIRTNLRVLRQYKSLKQSDMLDFIGVSGATWSDYERGKSLPPIEVLIKISENFQVSLDTLLKNELNAGNINVHLIQNLADQENAENVHLNVHPSVHPNAVSAPKMPYKKVLKQAQNEDKTEAVPIVDISVAAGTGHFNDTHTENIDVLRLPVQFLKRNAHYLCVRIKGPSMAPTLQDGGYVVIRLLDRSEWAKMPDERVFVVSDREGKAYLKRIKNRFKQGLIVLRSDSPDTANYPSFNLTVDEIHTIWEVEWYFTAKMPNIHDQYYSRLQRLEDKLDAMERRIEPKLK